MYDNNNYHVHAHQHTCAYTHTPTHTHAHTHTHARTHGLTCTSSFFTGSISRKDDRVCCPSRMKKLAASHLYMFNITSMIVLPRWLVTLRWNEFCSTKKASVFLTVLPKNNSTDTHTDKQCNINTHSLIHPLTLIHPTPKYIDTHTLTRLCWYGHIEARILEGPRVCHAWF